ncbi:hypothetical protein [Actinomycetospora termitidis]|uniref:Uncharacterized protein n=1 Tax=Actinomycetospora termitidis TaxID=3053470 RepID=A0ABT7MIU1_9PSEU|nr:hypothetical protein [Actinomycetospora sp. Odt1-22]MDL5160593.1 hypothetical protein [Actinomycetospora sp. Odt1-22]
MQTVVLAAGHPSIAVMLLMILLEIILSVGAIFLFLRMMMGGSRRLSNQYGAAQVQAQDEMTYEEAHEIAAAVNAGEMRTVPSRDQRAYRKAVEMIQHRRSDF